MNLCVTCGMDFTSVDAFDRHRVGTHAYLFAEGLRLEPPRYDGRRCLDAKELTERGWVRSDNGPWTDPTSIRKRAARGAIRSLTASGTLVKASTRIDGADDVNAF